MLQVFNQNSTVSTSTSSFSMLTDVTYPIVTINGSINPEQNTDDPLLSVIQEIDRRRTDIGYGFGYYLGRKIGTNKEIDSNSINENFDDNLDEYKSAFQEDISEMLTKLESESDLDETPCFDFEPMERSFEEPSQRSYFGAFTQWLQKIEPLKSVSRFLGLEGSPEKLVTTEIETNEDTGTPQAIILKTAYENYYAQRLLAPYSLDLLNGLAQNYDVHLDTISTIPQLCKSINRVANLGPIKFLLINGHGYQDILGLSGIGSSGSAIQAVLEQPLQELNVSITDENLSCLERLDKDAIIVLQSCFTGSDASLAVPNSNYTIPMNIQKLIAYHAPGRTIYAPQYAMLGHSFKIEFEPSFHITALGMYLNTDHYHNALNEINLKLDTNQAHLNTLEMQMLRFTAFIINNFSDNPYAQQFIEMTEKPAKELLGEWLDTLGKVNEIFSFVNFFVNPLFDDLVKRPLAVISPEKSEFCKETLSYFYLRKYCDAVNVKPNSDKIQECMEETLCKNAISLLDKRTSKYTILVKEEQKTNHLTLNQS